jgi:ribonuclease HII
MSALVLIIEVTRDKEIEMFNKKTAEYFEVVLNSGYESDWEIATLAEAKKIEGAVRILAFNYNCDAIRQYDLVNEKWEKTISLY